MYDEVFERKYTLKEQNHVRCGLEFILAFGEKSNYVCLEYKSLQIIWETLHTLHWILLFLVLVYPYPQPQKQFHSQKWQRSSRPLNWNYVCRFPEEPESFKFSVGFVRVSTFYLNNNSMGTLFRDFLVVSFSWFKTF